MPNTFKSITLSDIPSGGSTIYTVPAATQTVVIGFHIANKHTAEITVDIEASGVFIGNGIKIPADTTLVPIEGKLVLEATETVTLTPSVTAVSDVHMSILEIS